MSGTNSCTIQISILSGDLYSYTRRREYFIYLHNMEHVLMRQNETEFNFDASMKQNIKKILEENTDSSIN